MMFDTALSVIYNLMNTFNQTGFFQRLKRFGGRIKHPIFLLLSSVLIADDSCYLMGGLFQTQLQCLRCLSSSLYNVKTAILVWHVTVVGVAHLPNSAISKEVTFK